MSVAKRLPYQDRLRRYVVAPLILFLCGLTVVTALTLGAGRGLLFFASEFTPQLNSMLASKRISLEGVQAQWRGINPVVQVQKLTFGAGQFQNLELDGVGVGGLEFWVWGFLGFWVARDLSHRVGLRHPTRHQR